MAGQYNARTVRTPVSLEHRTGLRRSGNLSGKVGGGQIGKDPECQAKQFGIYPEDNPESLKVLEQ